MALEAVVLAAEQLGLVVVMLLQVRAELNQKKKLMIKSLALVLWLLARLGCLVAKVAAEMVI